MSWKALTLATTVLVAVGLTAGAASARTGMTASVNLSVGGVWNSGEDPSDIENSYSAMAGGARVNIPYSDTTNFQIDVFGDSTFTSFDDTYGGGFGAGLHLNYRDKDGLLGVFAGVGRNSNGDETNNRLFFAGLEGQFFWKLWTFYGQVGYLDAQTGNFQNNNGFGEAGFVRGVARYYVNKHVKLEGELSYADGQQIDGNDAHLVGWDVRGEWQFAQTMPISVFLSYDGLYSRNDSFPSRGGTITESQVNVGLRFLFGTNDPMENDRDGTPVDLPNFPHWVHQAGEAVE